MADNQDPNIESAVAAGKAAYDAFMAQAGTQKRPYDARQALADFFHHRSSDENKRLVAEREAAQAARHEELAGSAFLQSFKSTLENLGGGLSKDRKAALALDAAAATANPNVKQAVGGDWNQLVASRGHLGATQSLEGAKALENDYRAFQERGEGFHESWGELAPNYRTAMEQGDIQKAARITSNATDLVNSHFGWAADLNSRVNTEGGGTVPPAYAAAQQESSRYLSNIEAWNADIASLHGADKNSDGALLKQGNVTESDRKARRAFSAPAEGDSRAISEFKGKIRSDQEAQDAISNSSLRDIFRLDPTIFDRKEVQDALTSEQIAHVRGILSDDASPAFDERALDILGVLQGANVGLGAGFVEQRLGKVRTQSSQRTNIIGNVQTILSKETLEVLETMPLEIFDNVDQAKQAVYKTAVDSVNLAKTNLEGLFDVANVLDTINQEAASSPELRATVRVLAKKLQDRASTFSEAEMEEQQRAKVLEVKGKLDVITDGVFEARAVAGSRTRIKSDVLKHGLSRESPNSWSWAANMGDFTDELSPIVLAAATDAASAQAHIVTEGTAEAAAAGLTLEVVQEGVFEPIGLSAEGGTAQAIAQVTDDHGYETGRAARSLLQTNAAEYDKGAAQLAAEFSLIIGYARQQDLTLEDSASALLGSGVPQKEGAPGGSIRSEVWGTGSAETPSLKNQVRSLLANSQQGDGSELWVQNMPILFEEMLANHGYPGIEAPGASEASNAYAREVVDKMEYLGPERGDTEFSEASRDFEAVTYNLGFGSQVRGKQLAGIKFDEDRGSLRGVYSQVDEGEGVGEPISTFEEVKAEVDIPKKATDAWHQAVLGHRATKWHSDGNVRGGAITAPPDISLNKVSETVKSYPVPEGWSPGDAIPKEVQQAIEEDLAKWGSEEDGPSDLATLIFGKKKNKGNK